MNSPSIGNSNNGFDVKQILMSLFMVNSLNGTGTGQNTGFTMIYSMLAITIIEKIMSNIPLILLFIEKYMKKMWKENVNISVPNIIDKEIITKASSITVVVQFNKPEILGSALLDFITNHKNTKSIYYINNNFSLNEKNPIKICDKNDIYINVLKPDNTDSFTISEILNMARVSNETAKQPTTDESAKQIIEIYSTNSEFTNEKLRKFLNDMSHNYSVKMQNKLGDKIYYFNMVNLPPIPADPNGNYDYSFSPPVLTFTMKQFTSNRRFTNVVGEKSALIQQRVRFFQNNEKWYNDTGIPYTLGLLLHGPPGTGKTSTIKSCAMETNRHIINIQFNDALTKSQMEALFYNETINVHNSNGKTEQFIIPIDKRIYVFEDIDCQTEMLLDRKLLETVNNLKEENETLRKKFNKNTNSYLPVLATPKEQFTLHGIRTNPNKPIDGSYQQLTSEKLNLSIFLNLLDGILETPGRIIIMTSNYPEKLDSALIRPGRIDLITYFSNCNTNMMIECLEYFFRVTLTTEQKELVNTFPQKYWSPAELTKIMYENHDSIENTLELLTKQTESIKQKQKQKQKQNNVDSLELELELQ